MGIVDYFTMLAVRYYAGKANKMEARLNYRGAIGYYDKLIRLLPTLSSAIIRKAICLFELEEYSEAAIFAKKALDLDSDNVNYRFYNAMIAYSEKHEMEAIDRMWELLEKEEMDIGLLEYFASLAFENKYYDKALKAFNKLAPLSNEPISIEIGKALCLSQLGKTLESIGILEQVLLVEPENDLALNNIGFEKLKIHQYQEAILDFDKAIQINKDFAYAFDNRGFAYMKLGNLEQAITDINHSISLDKTNSYAFKNKALYYLEIEDTEKAIACLQTARSLGYAKKYDDEVDKLLGDLGIK